MSELLKRKGPWSAERIDRFLDETRVPIRIAGSGPSGHPVMVSLWFVREGDKLWCATQRTSSVASILGRDPRCGFEVSVENWKSIRRRSRAQQLYVESCVELEALFVAGDFEALHLVIEP